MLTYDKIKAPLLKVALFLVMILCFCACTTREERISSIEAEIKLLRDSVEADTEYFMAPRLQEKAALEDTLNAYAAPFKKRIALLNEMVLSTEKEFRKDLRAAKGRHFSRHGHDPGSQGSLNRIIDDLISQKEKEVKEHQAEISRIEDRYKSDSFYSKTTKRIAVLESELEGVHNNISQRLKMRIKQLEDTLLLFAP